MKGQEIMHDPRIIIVEDDAVIAELIEFNLQNDGYETKGFRDGPSMLAALPQLLPISLIILDIMLPGPDGFEICRLLKRRPQSRIYSRPDADGSQY
jgi:two-component system OmpR family response regulator